VLPAVSLTTAPRSISNSTSDAVTPFARSTPSAPSACSVRWWLLHSSAARQDDDDDDGRAGGSAACCCLVENHKDVTRSAPLQVEFDFDVEVVLT